MEELAFSWAYPPKEQNRIAFPGNPAISCELKDPRLSVSASRRVWLHLGFYDWHTFSKMSRKIRYILDYHKEIAAPLP
jgi:hypothetical protein